MHTNEPTILDVRHMRRLPLNATAEHVAEDAAGFLGRKLQRPVDHTESTVVAYVNDSRWVADCPECNGGIMLLPGHDQGTCLDCGHTFKVKWPAKRTMSAALAVLLARPEAKNRNWHPTHESVDDLKVENVTRGVPLKL